MFNLLLLSIGALIRLSVAVHCSPATGGVGAQVFSRLRPVCEIRVRGSWGRSIPEDKPCPQLLRETMARRWRSVGSAEFFPSLRPGPFSERSGGLRQRYIELSAPTFRPILYYVCAPRALSGPCPPKVSILCRSNAVFRSSLPRIAPFSVADKVLTREKVVT